MLTRVSRGPLEGVGCSERLESRGHEEEGLRVYGRVKLLGNGYPRALHDDKGFQVATEGGRFSERLEARGQEKKGLK